MIEILDLTYQNLREYTGSIESMGACTSTVGPTLGWLEKPRQRPGHKPRDLPVRRRQPRARAAGPGDGRPGPEKLDTEMGSKIMTFKYPNHGFGR